MIGIDIGKNSFHVVGHDQRGAIVLRQKWSRRQVETRLASLSPCLIGMEAGVGEPAIAARSPWRSSCQLLLLAKPEHGRTIPLADIGRIPGTRPAAAYASEGLSCFDYPLAAIRRRRRADVLRPG